MKLLCYFGWHKWNHTYTPASCLGFEGFHVQATCARCGSYHHRLIDGPIHIKKRVE